MRNISKDRFSGEGVLLNSIMEIHCSTAEGKADQNQMAVDVKGGAIKFFFTLRRSLMHDPYMEGLQKAVLGFEVFNLRIVCIKAIVD